MRLSSFVQRRCSYRRIQCSYLLIAIKFSLSDTASSPKSLPPLLREPGVMNHGTALTVSHPTRASSPCIEPFPRLWHSRLCDPALLLPLWHRDRQLLECLHLAPFS